MPNRQGQSKGPSHVPSHHVHQPLARLLGVEANTTSHAEKWLSIIGSTLGMAFACWLSSQLPGGNSLAWMLASTGASAALIFAIPHGALSQPWPVLGGHVISAFIGVSCQRYLPTHEFAAIAATGLSIAAMYYLRCLHPPGVTTALFAVMGGAEIHQLSYSLLLNPVLLNACTLVLAGLLFNNLFPSRRYPSTLGRSAAAASNLQEEDVAKALRELDSFVDISPEDLSRLYTCANSFAEQRRREWQHRESRILRLRPRMKAQPNPQSSKQKRAN